MRNVKHFDPAFHQLAVSFALRTKDFMAGLIPAKEALWVQEAVMLTMLDGAATLAASMGVSKEEIANYLGERWDLRRKELSRAADGALRLPGVIKA